MAKLISIVITVTGEETLPTYHTKARVETKDGMVLIPLANPHTTPDHGIRLVVERGAAAVSALTVIGK